MNLSLKQLEAPHLAALSKGLNFASAPSSIPKVKAAVGRANASESVTAKARMNVIGAISRARLPPKNITSQEARALRDLAKDEDILLLPADKGKATVVMDRADYDAKVGQMLNDENTYQLLKRDPTASLERKMNSQLLHFVQVGQLHNDVYLRVRSSAGRTPLFYGLPKVHKPSVTLCRIVLCVIPHLPSIKVPGRPATTGGRKDQLTCEELQGIRGLHQVRETDQ